MSPLMPEQKKRTRSRRSSQAPLVADARCARGRALLGAAMTFPPLAAPGSSDGAPLAVGNGRIIASRATPLQSSAARLGSPTWSTLRAGERGGHPARQNVIEGGAVTEPRRGA